MPNSESQNHRITEQLEQAEKEEEEKWNEQSPDHRVASQGSEGRKEKSTQEGGAGFKIEIEIGEVGEEEERKRGSTISLIKRSLVVELPIVRGGEC